MEDKEKKIQELIKRYERTRQQINKKEKEIKEKMNKGKSN